MNREFYFVEVYRRYGQDEDVVRLYKSVMADLHKLEPPWGLKDIPPQPVPDFAGDPELHVGFKPKHGLKPPLESLVVNIANRSRTKKPDDDSLYDDQLLIRFKLRHPAVDYRQLVSRIFPTYIATMNAYSALVNSADILLKDDDDAEGRPFNGRRQVDRIGPANYWDRELCSRAFGMPPERVVERLKPRVTEARLLHGGALVIYSFDPMPGDEISKIDAELRPLLK